MKTDTIKDLTSSQKPELASIRSSRFYSLVLAMPQDKREGGGNSVSSLMTNLWQICSLWGLYNVPSLVMFHEQHVELIDNNGNAQNEVEKLWRVEHWPQQMFLFYFYLLYIFPSSQTLKGEEKKVTSAFSFYIADKLLWYFLVQEIIQGWYPAKKTFACCQNWWGRIF